MIQFKKQKRTNDKLNIKLDFRSKETLTSQLQGKIKHLILLNVLLPGDSLPAVRTLAAQLQINFNTVARAYRSLDEDGWISTRQGRGTYVLDRNLPTDQNVKLPSEDDQEEVIFQKAAELCQLADQAGISGIRLHQIIDQELAKKQPRSSPSKQLQKRITRKKYFNFPIWDSNIKTRNRTTKINYHKRHKYFSKKR